MFVWLITLACLVSAASGSNMQLPLTADALLTILLRLGFVDLYQASCVAKCFRPLAVQAVKIRYGIQLGGKIYLNYGLVLHEFDTLVEDAAKCEDMVKANLALEASPQFKCVQSVLEAQFGYCIKRVDGSLPEFCLYDVPLDILNDNQKSSVLPYILDQVVSDERWPHFVRRLVELERVDLLNQMTFSKLNSRYFYDLMSVPLPMSVVVKAAEALQRNMPTLELSNLVARAVLGEQTTFPEACRVPLFLLRYLHKKGTVIPDSLVLIDGLEDSSISFWMHLATAEAVSLTEMTNLIKRHGDDKARCLARTFYELTNTSDLTHTEAQTYQAVLTRFRFSANCNGHIIQNYDVMLKKQPSFYYQTVFALLDCRQFQMLAVDSCTFRSPTTFEALIDKMSTVQDSSLVAVIGKYGELYCDAPRLLKCLIQRKAGDSYIQVIWSSIQNLRGLQMMEHVCCLAPLESLKRLVFEQDISVDSVLEMLGQLDGFDSGGKFPKEVRILYTVLFWEAPERVIDYFLNLLPAGFVLDYALIFNLLLVTKYSSKLCGKLIARLETVGGISWSQIKEFRPDLAEELSLPNRQ